jgi:hypothetical protein
VHGLIAELSIYGAFVLVFAASDYQPDYNQMKDNYNQMPKL